jgi:hypothetical protein
MSSLAVALAWFDLGLGVFPCYEEDTWVGDKLHARKSPRTRRGFYDSFADREEVILYWTANPNHIVGVWCKNVLVVLDVDNDPEFGIDGQFELDENGVVPEPTFSVTTPRGGSHHFYRNPEGSAVGPDADIALPNGTILRGVDRRAGNSYFIAWSEQVPQRLDELAHAPEWLLVPSRNAATSPFSGSDREWFEHLPQGQPDEKVEKAMERFPRLEFAHDVMRNRQLELVRLGAEGHRGVPEALLALKDLWLVPPWNEPEWQQDWDACLRGAIRKYGALGTALVDHASEEGELAELLARSGRVDWVEAFNAEWEQEWFVTGFIAAQRGHSLYSDAGTGKSAIIRQACAELATQRVVLGTQAFSRPLVVLYFDHENSVLGDVVPHLKPLGYAPEELENLVFLSFPNIAELDTKQGGLEFERLLEHYKPELVVLDTVSRTISQDENLNKTWLDFYRFAGVKLKAREIAYIRLDHSGKVQSRGQRGGSAKKGDLDLVWHLSSSDGDKFLLQCEKNRLPLDSKTMGVLRKHDPFHHVIEDASKSLDWKSLIKKHERSEEIIGFVQDQIDKSGGVIGYTGLWKKHRDRFVNLGWRRWEIENAAKELTRRELGLDPDEHDELPVEEDSEAPIG